MQLTDSVTTLKYISSKYSQLLEKLDIYTIKDLLTYFPFKYVDTSEVTSIKDMILSEDFTKVYQVKGEISSFRNGYLKSRRTLQSAKLTDQTGNIKCIWFNQPFLENALKNGKTFIFSGHIKKGKSGFTFYPNFYEEVKEDKDLVHLARITPEYYLTAGLSKKWLRNRIKELVDAIEQMDIPNEIGAENLKTWIFNVHFPESYETLDESIKNLALYEFTNIQLKILENQAESLEKPAPILNTDKLLKDYEHILKIIPFSLTLDQEKVVESLVKLASEGKNINSLVQGDVGSGKTIVAFILAYLFAKQGFQSVILAPTTILAKQHYINFTKLLENENISSELVSSENKNSESKDILIGTSAVLARKINLIRNLGLVIVDEQHRFGVSQREELLKPLEEALNAQKFYPHFVNMTATPIPRTVAQALFGDIEVETINTKPAGRQPIKTLVVPHTKREDSYKWIADKLKLGDQVYWVCPLITESEVLNIVSAEQTFESLHKDKHLKKFKIALLHGKMKDAEKSQILLDFKEHKYDILVSTSVIEVGIDVSNATIMVIENSERFGLAQLHQIRGRVGRGSKESFCLMFYAKELKEKGLERLKFLSENDNGLKISEYDLQTRGPGEIYGFRQSGIPRLKIANFANLELIKDSRKIAQKLFQKGTRKIELFS